MAIATEIQEEGTWLLKNRKDGRETVKIATKDEIKQYRQGGMYIIQNVDEEIFGNEKGFARVLELYLSVLESDNIDTFRTVVNNDSQCKGFLKEFVTQNGPDRFFIRAKPELFKKYGGIEKEFFIRITSSSLRSDAKFNLMDSFVKILEKRKEMKRKIQSEVLKIVAYCVAAVGIFKGAFEVLVPSIRGVVSNGVSDIDYSGLKSMVALDTMARFQPVFVALAVLVIGVSLFALLANAKFVEVLKWKFRPTYEIVQYQNTLKLISYYLLGISEVGRDVMVKYFTEEFPYLKINQPNGIMFENIFQVVNDIFSRSDALDWFETTTIVKINTASQKEAAKQREILDKQRDYLVAGANRRVDKLFAKLSLFGQIVLGSAVIVGGLAFVLISTLIPQIISQLGNGA